MSIEEDMARVEGTNEQPPAAPQYPAVTPEQRAAAEQAALAELLILDRAAPMQWTANFVASCAGHGTVFVYWRGVFYRWDGCKYVDLNIDMMKQRAWNFLNATKTKVFDDAGNVTGYHKFNPKKPDVENFIDALKATVGIADIDAPGWIRPQQPWMPEPKDIIVMRNGLYDVRCGLLYPHTTAFFNLGATEFDYDPNAPEPAVFLKFLGEALPNDQESIDTLQEIFGYLLTPDTSQQKIFAFPGPPRAGKGTVMRTMQALLGSTNYTSITLDAFAETHGRKTLIGKNAAFIGDAAVDPRKALAASEGLKGISGEDSVNIPRKYLDDWIGYLTTRIVMAANDMPSLPDPSGALATRYIAVRFTQSFLGREDKTLTVRIRAELAGIFNWAMVGLKSLNKRGSFVQPATGQESIDEAAATGSHAIGFVTDCCELDGLSTTRTDHLYPAYVQWCSRNNQKALSTAWFGKRLRAAYGTRISQCKPSYDTDQPGVKEQHPSYFGIKLIKSQVECALTPR